MSASCSLLWLPLYPPLLECLSMAISVDSALWGTCLALGRVPAQAESSPLQGTVSPPDGVVAVMDHG